MIRPIWLTLCLSSVALWIVNALRLRGLDGEAEAAGPGLITTLVVGGLLVASLVWLGQTAVRLFRDQESDGRILLLFLVLSAVVRVVGIDHEIEERYYLDEGAYFRNATEINAGEMLRVRFVYPHLTYYLYAFAVFVGGVFPSARDLFAQTAFSVSERMAVDWLLMRLVVAGLATATTVPVYRLAGAAWRDIGSNGSARLVSCIAATALLGSTLFNEISHLMISDGPSAVFATFCVWFAYRAWQTDERKAYLAAGVLAALAATSKYPAGVVAVSVAIAWLLNRIQKRNWNWSLVFAGIASVSTFVLTMPSLLVYPRIALTGGQGMFFGVRQYGGGGWIGVMPSSNWLYYLELIAKDLGLPLALAALLGAVFTVSISKRGRLALLQLLSFPFVYLVLICSMNMVVRRNLLPATPTLCVVASVLLGLALTRLPKTAFKTGTGTLRPLVAGLLLATPLFHLVQQSIALSRPGTRVQARDWIEQNLPHGAFLVKESYTPSFNPGTFTVQQTRFAPRAGLEAIRAEWVDYVLLSSSAYARFFQDDVATREHHLESRRIYQEIFDRHELIRAWDPSSTRNGPRLELYRGGPIDPVHVTAVSFQGDDIFVPDGSMRAKSGTVTFTRPGQWLSAKALLSAGHYELSIDGQLPVGSDAKAPEVVVLTVENREMDRKPLSRELTAKIEMVDDAKVLLRLYLPEGSRVRSFSIAAGTES